MHGLQVKNSKGSALLLVMILSIVSGGILFALFMGSTASYKTQKQLSDKTLYAHFISDIKKELSWPDQCYISLQNQIYKPLRNNIIELKNFPYRNFSNITANLKIGSGLIISDITLKKKPLATLSRGEFVVNGSVKKWARNLPSKLRTRVVQLLIKVKSHLGYSFKPIPINLFVNTDPQNRIKSCYTELSVAYVCENLGNAWNAWRSRCEPYKQCFYSKKTTCRAPYSISVVGISSFRVCEWCNPNAP